uniref:Granulins domain-containing protein n=1 Tax=Oncorhynchus kisutch TaxID=8019 RepID=A0A8C7JDJ2_ONCKI
MNLSGLVAVLEPLKMTWCACTHPKCQDIQRICICCLLFHNLQLPCGSEVERCAATGFCCDSGTVESCVLDSHCFGESPYHSPADHSSGATRNSPEELLMHLLHFATRGQGEYSL